MTTRYGRTALRAECEKVKAATEGSRERELSLAAGHVGELVAGGEVSERDAWAELTFAARATGLRDHEVSATIRKGLARGARTPRKRSEVVTSDEWELEVAHAHEEAFAEWLREHPDHWEARAFRAGYRCQPCYDTRSECFHDVDVLRESWETV